MGTCVPTGTDWSCAYTDEQMAEMRLDAVKSAQIDRSEALAWSTLSALTGRQLATCPTTVRPCRAGCGPIGTWIAAPVGSFGHFAGVPGGYFGFAPYVNGLGMWVNSCGCASRADCSCSVLQEVILPGTVGDVVEVWVDGAALAPSAYRVDNGNRLVRLDGGDWPVCQDMTQDRHGADAFSVTYYAGAAPDSVSLYIAGVLAAEYLKACSGDKGCRLPANVTNVVRQGVTFQMRIDLFESGLTGIREVDDWVGALNPYRLKAPPVIAIPRARKPRMTTWSS